MSHKDSRLGKLIRCFLLVFVFALPAFSTHAQVPASDAPPPIRSWIDSNGVDLVSGALFTSDLQVSVGVSGQGGLSRTFFNGAGSFLPYGRDSLTGTLNSSGSTYVVSLGGVSYSFSLSGSTFLNLNGDGSTLTKVDSQNYTFVARDGTRALFNTTWGDSGGLIAANVARVTQVFKPSGEVLGYAYSTQTVQVSRATVTFVRPEAVTNNFGYEIKYLYSNAPTIAGMGYIIKVIALNNAVDFCGEWDTTCTGLTVAWPTINISTNPTTLVSTVTDNLGRQTTYPPFALANGTQTLIRPSGETLTIKYDASYRVTSLSNGNGTWLYSYVTSGATQTTTATDPNGHTRVVVVNTANSTVTSDTDGVGNKTSFQYDVNAPSHVTLITRQEGDKIGYTYDARGNVTNTVYTGKDGSSTISTSANFDTTCTYPAKCNQPNWTIDGRGYETNYSYNTTTGQVLSVIQPAGANGLRPETDLTYTSEYAWYKYLDGGSVAQSDYPVSMLTKTSQCTTAQTCPGTANAVQSAFSYGASGVANNLLVTSTTQGAGDGSLAATTQLTYDAIGNLYTVEDPLLRLTRYRFDTVRQLVGVVGPDPDGAGPLHNRAVRITYECDSSIKSGCDGLVTKIEQGTVLSEADSDWTAFATLGQRAVTYDGVDRKSTDIFSNGSTYIGASQFSYDSANRLTCQAQRMNPSAVASLPASACSLGTQGSAGPDRITYLTYDNANKLLTTVVGYGTSVQATAVTNTYGGDNETLTRADAKGHLTTIVHDTFNRIYQVEFPTPSNGSVSSTSDYEQYTYDNNGNITQNRRRDGTLVNFGYDALNLRTSGYNGATYGYDNLGRMTSAVVSGISESFGYDALSRQTSEAGPLGTVGRKYDVVGNLTRLTYPDSYYVAYGYDAANEFTSLTDSNSTTLLQKAYDNLGRISSLTRTSGPSESRGYGPDLRLSSQAYTFTDTSKNVTYSYTYNLAGQPLTMTPNNAIYSNTTSPAATSYASDGQNRYTTVGAHTMSYDGRSNLNNDGTHSFVFDGLNRITTVNGTTASYDALDRLYSTVSGSTRLLYSGQQIVAAYNSSGSLLNRYIPDLQLDKTLLWYSGSNTAVSGGSWLVTNAAGSVVAGAYAGTAAVSTYDAFGVSGSSGISPYNGNLGFKGMPSTGSSGIYYARARAYDASLGRFLQPDPAGYADGLNPYAFVHNSPVNGADPTGLDTGCTADEGGNVISCEVDSPPSPNPGYDGPPPSTEPPQIDPPQLTPVSIPSGAGAQSQQPLKPCAFRQGGCSLPPTQCVGSFAFTGQEVDLGEASVFVGGLVESTVPGLEVGSLYEGAVGGEGLVTGLAATQSASTGNTTTGFGFFGGSISAGPLAGLQVGIIYSGNEFGVYYESHKGPYAGGGGYAVSSCGN